MQQAIDVGHGWTVAERSRISTEYWDHWTGHLRRHPETLDLDPVFRSAHEACAAAYASLIDLDFGRTDDVQATHDRVYQLTLGFYDVLWPDGVTAEDI